MRMAESLKVLVVHWARMFYKLKTRGYFQVDLAGRKRAEFQQVIGYVRRELPGEPGRKIGSEFDGLYPS